MNEDEITDMLYNEAELQTSFHKEMENYVEKKERSKFINALIKKTDCDYDMAKSICDYYIDDIPLPSVLRLKKIIDEMEEEEQKELLNKPKCPTCQSTNIKKVSTTSKVINTAIYGIFGTKRYKTFHCNNCGYEW